MTAVLVGNRTFRVVVSARALFGLGDAAAIVAILWVATQQADNAGLVTGLATVALTLPTVALAPTLGPLIDRSARVRIMRRAAALRSVVLVGLVAAVATGSLAALATQGLLNVALAVGAGAGGFALASAGAPATLAALAVVAAVASVITFLVPVTALDHPVARDRGSWLDDLRDGLAAVASVRQLRLLVGLGVLSVLGFAPALVAVVALVDQRLDAGPDALGLLQTATTVGLVIGAALAHRAGRRWGSAVAMGSALVVMGAATAALGTAGGLLTAALLVTLRGLSNSVSSVHNATLLQRAAPPAVRGRVLSTALSVMEVPWLAAPVIGGVLVDAVGVTALYAGMGVCIAAAGIGALLLRGALETRPAPPDGGA